MEDNQRTHVGTLGYQHHNYCEMLDELNTRPSGTAHRCPRRLLLRRERRKQHGGAAVAIIRGWCQTQTIQIVPSVWTSSEVKLT